MYFKSLYIILLSIVGIAHAYQPTSAPLSQHGQIQNVQTYSSNPFWNPNGPYNQRMPQVIYVNGADMNAGDCQRTVSALIANVCANMNNCVGAQLSDIRPTVMLQLSRLPGHNYATSCAGYIDSEFENYVKQYGHAGVTNGTVSFPGATTQNPGVIEPEIKNPFEQPTPDWKSDIIERTQELEELQAQNGGSSGTLVKNDFPTTFADLSFSERMDIKSAGYAPYKDKKAYNSIKVPDTETVASGTRTAEQLAEFCKKNPNAPECKKQQNIENGLITEDIPDAFEALLPWYGILVVKAGSLDKYAAMDMPIISTEYMKSHRDEFYPANSDKALGLARACTHSNHMAHDKDVINRAAHMTMDEKDSFWSGNDYYVYDGQDVYWGWATIAGEVAMALITMGISAEAQLASNTIKISARTANAFKTSNRFIDAVNLTTDARKIDKAIDAARTVSKGDAAARAAARTALNDAGVVVKSGASYRDFHAIAAALEIAKGAGTTASWTSALWRPWRLVASGVKNIKPAFASTLGSGATWGKRFKTLGATGAVVGANYLGKELLKSFGYSSATLQDPTTGDVEFNSFGLLSADDIDGRENVVSHGAWISFDDVGRANEDDALNEAAAFAEEFAKDINTINAEDPLCDVDIYVVQPAISNPEKLPGKRQIYYILQTTNQPHMQVRSK